MDNGIFRLGLTLTRHYFKVTKGHKHKVFQEEVTSNWHLLDCRHDTRLSKSDTRHSTQTTHGGDHTWNVWISRSFIFPDRCFENRGLRLVMSKCVWNLWDPLENVFDMYEDARENLMEVLAVGSFGRIILSPTFSVCGSTLLRSLDLRHDTRQ